MVKSKVMRHSRREPPIAMLLAIAAFIFSAVFGWFAGLFIYGSSPALAEEGLYICTTQKGTWVNVREAPSSDARPVGTVRYGYEIHPVGEENGYFRIQTEGGEGYVRKEFFETPVKARGTANSRVVYRSKPNGKKIGHLNPGNWIDILAKTVDAEGTAWYRCYGNVYIMSRYLEVAK